VAGPLVTLVQSSSAYMAIGDFSLQEEFYLFASAVSVVIIEHLVRIYRSRDTGSNIVKQ